jgi:enoyl-CoA hydratase/carnithine racemase
MSESVTVSIDEHLAVVTLNRPDKANAVSMEMFDALGDTGERLAAEPSVRAVVLQGAGANFCAGIDVSIFARDDALIDASSMSPGERSPANRFQRCAYVWRELPVPVICAISGVAYGAGFQIAMGADLRYAAPDARMSIMEIKWGLIPDLAISTTLRDILPADRVKELAWTGRVIDANEALSLGLVTAVHDDPHAAAMQMAQEICSRSPDAVQALKKLVNSAWRMTEAEALVLEAKLQLRVLQGENQREAVLANVQQRKPDFSDPQR